VENRITVTEAAYICGVVEQTIRRWMETRDFPQKDKDGLILERDVLEWAGKRAIRTAKIVRG
jgi:predicted DNA-binding transcriptional regulator AlpA